jgi:hypothetical protein
MVSNEDDDNDVAVVVVVDDDTIVIVMEHNFPARFSNPGAGVGNGQANNQQGSKCGGYGRRSRIMRNLQCGEWGWSVDMSKLRIRCGIFLQPPLRDRIHIIVQYPNGEHSVLSTHSCTVH